MPCKKITPQKRLIARLILLAVLAGLAWFVWHLRHQPASVNQTPAPPNTGQETPKSSSQVPSYALDMLQYIRRNGDAPDGFVGGREFMNREKKLPLKDSDNKIIRYSEWDVHTKVKGQNRGPERLVTGSDHSAYYTRDHYKTFMKID